MLMSSISDEWSIVLVMLSRFSDEEAHDAPNCGRDRRQYCREQPVHLYDAMQSQDNSKSKYNKVSDAPTPNLSAIA